MIAIAFAILGGVGLIGLAIYHELDERRFRKELGL